MLQGAAGLEIQRASKHAFPTYAGAPQGIVKVNFDLAGKMKSVPEAQGALLASLTGGSSLGPAFLITPIPGEADRAIAVCEYTGYPLSVLDFANLKTAKTVRKNFLPANSPTQVGLGPYTSAWVTQAGAQWLYVTGYTGMARIRYSQGGKPVGAAIRSDTFVRRLSATEIDGHRRTSMKKIDGLIPIFGGRLMDCGYGISGRGGDPFSTGVELFDPQLLGEGDTQNAPSQTAAYLSRCFALRTLRSRMVWNAADGSRRQEIFAASGSVKRQFVNELGEQDKALAPANLDAKIFCYEVGEKGALRDLFGFSLPPSPDGRSIESHIVLSPCNRFLVILTQDGVLYTYEIATKRFVDGLVIEEPDGRPVNLLEFHRPCEIIFTSPDGQIFFLTAHAGENSGTANFHRISVAPDGRLAVQPHVGINCDGKDGWKDFDRIVRCFMPDLTKADGSYDFVLGYSQSTVAPFVRVITDFIAPRETGR